MLFVLPTILIEILSQQITISDLILLQAQFFKKLQKTETKTRYGYRCIVPSILETQTAMKLVLIASRDNKTAEKISETLPQNQKAAIIQSSNQLVSLSNGSAIVIVDHNFYEQYGLDFF